MSKTKASQVVSNVYLDLNVAPGFIFPDWFEHDTHNYFKIKNLQRKELTSDNIFSEEDFICEYGHRRPAVVKMGCLLIEYCYGGKASFELDVKFIDKELRQTRSLLLFKGARYASFHLSDIIPIHDDVSNATIIKKIPSIASFHAKQVRDIITKLALGQVVPQAEFQEVAANFFGAVEAYNQEHTTLPIHAASPHATGSFAEASQFAYFKSLEALDVRDFGGSGFQKKPRSEAELAAKLAACFFLELGINEEQIKKIITEYVDLAGKPLDEMDEGWVNLLMTTLIDRERYCLKTVFPEEISGDVLRKVINDIQEEQAALLPPF